MSFMTLSSSDDQDQNDNMPNVNVTSNDQLHLFINNLSLINTPNEYGWTPLYRSIISSNLQATKELLKKGADPNQINQMGETALYQAVEMELYDQTETLLNFNADPNITKSDGMSPLICAVKKSNNQLVRLLLEHKALPNLQNRLYNQTAFHLAVKSNTKIEIIQLLLQYNASLTIKDKYNKTPLDYADLNNEELMTYLNIAICHMSNTSSPISNKGYSHPISSTSYAKSSTTNQFSIKKALTSNFLISTPKEDYSTNTYQENNIFTFEKGLASFYTSNSKKQNSSKDILSEISPLEVVMTTSNNNSHIFSELQENNTSNRLNTNEQNISSSNNIKSSLNEINISEIPVALFKKTKTCEKVFEPNSNPQIINSNPQLSKMHQKGNNKKISYHRSSNNINKYNSKYSNSNENSSQCIIDNKENNQNAFNILKARPSDYSSENQTDYDSNIGITKNTISSRLYSINSTRLPTLPQTKLTIENNIKKNYVCEKKQSIFDNYISKGNHRYYTQDNRVINNYSLDQVKPLHDWLTSIDLLCYFNTFTTKGLYEIEPLIQQLKTGEIDLALQDIEEFGIKKTGHIYRFILKAQCDAEFFDPLLINYLFGDRSNTNLSWSNSNYNKNQDNFLRLSKNSTVCGCCVISKTTIRRDIDLSTWLNFRGLYHLRENFTHNGFELFEYVLLQMFSDYFFTNTNIVELFHIYNIEDRKKLLRELTKEKKKICNKLNIEFNDIICDDDDGSNCQMCIVF